MLRPPPISTLFPYTTLFRSVLRRLSQDDQRLVLALRPRLELHGPLVIGGLDVHLDDGVAADAARDVVRRVEQLRSEEHTSELQSRRDLVCRLLLEKKKNNET